MNIKLILYCVIVPLTIWCLESLNIEQFFKKNHIVQIQILYFLVSLAFSYLIVNFCYDIFLNSPII